MRVRLVEPFRFCNRFQVLCTLLDELGDLVDFHEDLRIAASIHELFKIVIDALNVFNIIIVCVECFELSVELLLFSLIFGDEVFLEYVSSILKALNDLCKPDVDVRKLSLL